MSPRYFCILFAFLSATIIPSIAKSAPSNDSIPHPKRPTVGLVLSGGGAKGFAYVGLLRVIQEVGLPIDYIGGSSIGSIIGGLYAIGYHPDTIAVLIRSQNWNNLLRDITDRKYIAFEEKEHGEKTLISLPLKNKKIGIGSMYKGQEINLLLNDYFSPAYKINDFNKFQTPFLCIGTNLFTGDQVVLNSGYLPMAVRSSMSIPGFFTPTDYQGHYLVDGGVVNNYPAKELKEMGAEIIIGGDVQSGLYQTREELASLTAIIDQITSFARIRANVIGDSLTDIKVRIKMNYGMMDFEKYDSIIAVGERVARSHYAEIKALADSLNAIEYKPLKQYTASPLKKVWIDDLIISGNNKMSDLYFKSIFGKYENSEISLEELRRDIRLTYGSGFFESVSYSFENWDNKTNLKIEVAEGGPGVVSAGVHYNSDYGINLSLTGAFRNIVRKNSKLFADLNIANNPRLRLQFLNGFGGQAAVGTSGEFYTFKINVYEKNAKENTLNLTNYKASLFFNYNFRNLVNMKAGFDYEYFRFRQDIIIDSTLIPLENFSGYGTLFFSLNADTRNRPYYATKGFKAAFRAEYVMPFSSDFSSEVFSNSLIMNFKFDDNIMLGRRFVLQPGIFAGATLRDETPPVNHWMGLGGLTPDNYISTYVPFTGLHFIQRFGFYSLVGRLNLQYNVYNKLYVNLRTDFGSSEMSLDGLFDSRNFLAGYGVTASYNSFIGPLEFSVMGSNINPGLMFFLNLGYWF
jgi:NTE family protein